LKKKGRKKEIKKKKKVKKKKGKKFPKRKKHGREGKQYYPRPERKPFTWFFLLFFHEKLGGLSPAFVGNSNARKKSHPSLSFISFLALGNIRR